MPALLLARGRVRGYRDSSESSRRDDGRRLPRPVRQAGRLSKADGLGLQVGIVRWLRLQFRLSSVIHTRGDVGETGAIQLHDEGSEGARTGGTQHLIQGRERGGFSYVLLLRPRQ